MGIYLGNGPGDLNRSMQSSSREGGDPRRGGIKETSFSISARKVGMAVPNLNSHRGRKAAMQGLMHQGVRCRTVLSRGIQPVTVEAATGRIMIHRLSQPVLPTKPSEGTPRGILQIDSGWSAGGKFLAPAGMLHLRSDKNHR